MRNTASDLDGSPLNVNSKDLYDITVYKLHKLGYSYTYLAELFGVKRNIIQYKILKVKNPEAIKEKSQKQKERESPELASNRYKKWVEKNPDKKKAYDREYNERNKDKRNEQRRERRRKAKEESQL